MIHVLFRPNYFVYILHLFGKDCLLMCFSKPDWRTLVGGFWQWNVRCGNVGANGFVDVVVMAGHVGGLEFGDGALK